ncbi:MAG TPA: transglutaminase family protein [Stellaceae bacterium]
MRLKVRHETVYRYEEPASYSIQYVRLTPPSNAAQRVLRWRLSTPGRVREHVDAFGNPMHVVVVDRPHSEIRIGVTGEVESHDTDGVWPDDGEPHPPALFLRSTPLTASDPALLDFAGGFAERIAANAAGGLEAMMQAIRSHVCYVQGATHVGTTAAGAWQSGAGVCQDHAHVFTACCRALGVPARYVSGYLFTDGQHDEMASHAWVEAWVDGVGWLGHDVTNGLRAGRQHVRLAAGLDYLDASPIRGMRRGGGSERMVVRVFVTDGQPASAIDQQQQQQQ